MSKLLINEPPLQVLPSLATVIGLNKAIFLQQLHYWIDKAQKDMAMGEERSYFALKDGQTYIRCAYDRWQKSNFPFWSVRTIKRVVLDLEKEGLILSVDNSEFGDHFDRTKWYTIAYEQVDMLESDKLAHSSSTKLAPSERDKVACSSLRENIRESSSNAAIEEDSQQEPPAPIPKPNTTTTVLDLSEEEKAKIVERKTKILTLYRSRFGHGPSLPPGASAAVDMKFYYPAVLLAERMSAEEAIKLLSEKRQKLLDNGKRKIYFEDLVCEILADLDRSPEAKRKSDLRIIFDQLVENAPRGQKVRVAWFHQQTKEVKRLVKKAGGERFMMNPQFERLLQAINA